MPHPHRTPQVDDVAVVCALARAEIDDEIARVDGDHRSLLCVGVRLDGLRLGVGLRHAQEGGPKRGRDREGADKEATGGLWRGPR